MSTYSRIPRIQTLCIAIVLTACSNDVETSGHTASMVDGLTSAKLAQLMSTPAAQAASLTAWNHARTLSPAAYGSSLAEAATDAPFQIDGLTFSGVRSAVIANAATYRALDEAYATIGDAFDALHITATVSLDAETLAQVVRSSYQALGGGSLSLADENCPPGEVWHKTLDLKFTQTKTPKKLPVSSSLSGDASSALQNGPVQVQTEDSGGGYCVLDSSVPSTQTSPPNSPNSSAPQQTCALDYLLPQCQNPGEQPLTPDKTR